MINASYMMFSSNNRRGNAKKLNLLAIGDWNKDYRRVVSKIPKPKTIKGVEGIIPDYTPERPRLVGVPFATSMRIRVSVDTSTVEGLSFFAKIITSKHVKEITDIGWSGEKLEWEFEKKELKSLWGLKKKL